MGERFGAERIRRVLATATPAMLIAWFAILSVHKAIVFVSNDWLYVDFDTYRRAAAVALAGGDPWAAVATASRFAAPPPTLLAYVPLALVPEPIGRAVSIALLGAAAIALLRSLGLPLWWLLFPPIVESLLAGNPDVAVVALLCASGRCAVLAPVLKLYAVIPLLLAARWRTLVLAGIVMLPSVVWVPAYVAHVGELGSVLFDQANGGLSAWGSWLLVPVALAVASLGRRDAGWLTVPAIWPATQLHYSCIAVPGLIGRPLLAAAMAIAIPLVGPLAIVAVAVAGRTDAIRGRLRTVRTHRGAPHGQPIRVIVES